MSRKNNPQLSLDRENLDAQLEAAAQKRKKQKRKKKLNRVFFLLPFRNNLPLALSVDQDGFYSIPGQIFLLNSGMKKHSASFLCFHWGGNVQT